MTVFKNGEKTKEKEYELQISERSVPSTVNPQVLIVRDSDWMGGTDSCTIDIDSPMKEAYIRFQDYSQTESGEVRHWTFAEVEEWIAQLGQCDI